MSHDVSQVFFQVFWLNFCSSPHTPGQKVAKTRQSGQAKSLLGRFETESLFCRANEKTHAEPFLDLRTPCIPSNYTGTHVSRDALPVAMSFLLALKKPRCSRHRSKANLASFRNAQPQIVFALLNRLYIFC